MASMEERSILTKMAKPEPEDDADQDFGYAIITSSTRSRSYMPTMHRYGLVTPFDEPDNLNGIDTPAAKASTPPRASLCPATSSQPTSHSTRHHNSFSIPRKPVNPAYKPAPPAKPLDYEAAPQPGGGACEEAPEPAHSPTRPANASMRSPPRSSDESARAGCLHAFGIPRLRKKAVRKMGEVVDRVEHIRTRRLYQNMKSARP